MTSFLLRGSRRRFMTSTSTSSTTSAATAIPSASSPSVTPTASSSTATASARCTLGPGLVRLHIGIHVRGRGLEARIGLGGIARNLRQGVGRDIGIVARFGHRIRRVGNQGLAGRRQLGGLAGVVLASRDGTDRRIT